MERIPPGDPQLPARRASAWSGWLIPACAAAVLALATLLVIKMPADPALPAVKKPVIEAVQAPVQPIVSFVPVLRGSLKPTDVPTLDLPIQSLTLSMQLVSNAIFEERQFPSREVVRLEEILNHFPLLLNGTAAIVPGPGGHLATLTTETIPCPWKPSATLLIIALRGNPLTACDVKLSYHAAHDSVFRYRLLGFSSTDGVPADALPSLLAAGSSTVLALEIEPSRPGGNLGTLRWTAAGKPAPEIPLIHRADAEPSDDARFAALVCTFGQWLTGEQAGTIDAETVAALARETSSATLPADRAKFIALVGRALDL